MTHKQPALPEPVTHGMRRKGTAAIIGIIPNKIAARPATGEKWMDNFEDAPLYTADQLRAYGAERERAGREGGWLPIESAPKGESVMIACKGDKGWAIGEAMLHSNGEWWWTNNDPTDSWGTNVYPDFWQPLPQPPTAPKEADNG